MAETPLKRLPWLLRDVLYLALAVAAIISVGWLLDHMPFRMDYYNRVIVTIGINVALAVSLNIINGHAGQFSMGHARFMAIRAFLRGPSFSGRAREPDRRRGHGREYDEIQGQGLRHRLLLRRRGGRPLRTLHAGVLESDHVRLHPLHRADRDGRPRRSRLDQRLDHWRDHHHRPEGRAALREADLQHLVRPAHDHLCHPAHPAAAHSAAGPPRPPRALAPAAEAEEGGRSRSPRQQRGATRRMKTDPQAPLLDARNVTIRFGGLTPVSQFNLTIRPHELAGLIGPNGAGKTTAFNLLTGVYHPSEGEILVGGVTTTQFKPYQITALGVSRTFQNIRLFKDLSLLDNVKIGGHIHYKYSTAAAVIHTNRFQAADAQADDEAIELLRIFALHTRARRLANNLPSRDHRTLEIAR